MSSLGDEYGTPDDLFEAVSRDLGPFTMDGAATAENTKLPKFTSDANLDTWHGNIWLNPPFSKMPYFSKLLCRADPSTGWWEKNVHDVADSVLFLRKRPKFIGGDASYNFPVCLVLYGFVLSLESGATGYGYYEGWK
jgi:hypothetical protein